MPAPKLNPFRRQLAVIAAPAPLAALEYALPICLDAVRAVVGEGWEFRTGSVSPFDELMATEAVLAGGTVFIAAEDALPEVHWARLLKIVYGDAVRLFSYAATVMSRWDRIVRGHYPRQLPAPLAALAIPGVVLHGAAAAIVLPPLGQKDPVIEHALWLCQRNRIPTFNVATISGLQGLHDSLLGEAA